MQRGTTHYVARQHTVSQVQGGEVMSVNEILMQEGIRNSMGKASRQKYCFEANRL